MSKIQVEVRFTDKLESIRVGGQDMEIPNAIKTKSVEEWFEPAAGRVNWDGLGAEIKAMGFSDEKNAVYSFQFNGPEGKKREFMGFVERFCWVRKRSRKRRRKPSRTICRMPVIFSRSAMRDGVSEVHGCG